MNLFVKDAKLFFDLMWGLQRFVNRQFGIIRDTPSPEKFAELPTKEKIKVRDAIWKTPSLIDDYVKQNPEALSPEQLEIVLNWKRFIKGEFFILRHLKKYTVFIGNKNQVYGVLGLFDSIEAFIPPDSLPVMVETVLLPFKGLIVYDGLLQGYNVSFGAGIRSDLNHAYTVAKQKERIITTLDPVTGQVQAGKQKIVKSNLPQLDEIRSLTSKLKGETPLQKAVFSLMNASIELGGLAETSPHDLDLLFGEERKIIKSVNRISKVLDIEAED